MQNWMEGFQDSIDLMEEKLTESFFTEETRMRMQEIERENRFLNHRKFR